MTTHLGTLTRSETGFIGTIETLAFQADIEIRQHVGESDKAPDYRIFSSTGREIGAGWSRKSRRGCEFISLKLQDPALGSLPLYPALVESKRSKGTWNLLLNGGEAA